GFATASVVSGLGNGVRRLSELNMILAALLMGFVLLVGPTLFIFNSFVETVGYYAASLPTMSFWTETFSGTDWQNSWTVFYWGWWVSWSPFVGIFIARVSKGRTVREFILGVLLLPSMLTFLWMSVFGGTALNFELGEATAGVISTAVGENVATALFVMLQQLPLTGITSFVGIVLVVVFFVTSSDSGSLVVDSLTSGGKLESPVPQRVFWAVMEGVVAAVLLLGGGLSALQTASITTGLPFAVVLLVMCYSVYKGLSYEHDVVHVKRQLQASEAAEEAIAS
ncbi:MAG: BCCT family transporter, partial [Cyanobacteria bacterium P01_H01_bin.153]